MSEEKKIITTEEKPVKKEKVAIVGFAGSRDQAPFDNPEYEIWTVNNLHKFVPRQDRIFQMHQRWEWTPGHGNPEEHGVLTEDHLEYLRTCGLPVYCVDKFDDIPTSIRFPIEKMTEEFGVQRTGHAAPDLRDGYWTNSISMMIALAIYEKFKVIEIYGVDMAVDCLAPETKVLNADLQWVRSDEVNVGDELIGFDEYPDSGDGKTRKWRKTIVTKAERLKKPCYEIKLEDGTTFVASENHGWLTHAENTNRWKTSKELSTRHHRRPTKIIKLLDTWEGADGYDAGYLAAAFDGEGCFCNSLRSGMDHLRHWALSFAQKSNEMKDRVVSLLTKYGFRWNEGAVNKSETKEIVIRGGRPEIMRFLGMFNPCRLKPKFDPDLIGELQAKNNVAVVSAVPVGERDVIGMETTTKTFIAEGFASHNSEYHWQRPSCEYYIGIAKGRGIDVKLPVESDLLKTRFIYGFEDEEIHAWKKKVTASIQSMHQRKAEADRIMRIHQSISDKYEGAITAVQEMDKTWK